MGEPDRRFDLGDSEIEVWLVARRRLDLDVPAPAAMAESRSEAVAIARVVRLSGL